MTLVVSVLTQDYVMQVSDRCMTIELGDGTVGTKKGHNKAVFSSRGLRSAIRVRAELVVATLTNGSNTRSGREPDATSGLRSALDGLTRDFPRTSGEHAFVGVGWGFAHEPVPVLLTIANCIDPKGQWLGEAKPAFATFEVALSPRAPAFVHQVPERITGQDWGRLQAQVAYVVGQGNDPEAMSDVLVEAVRRVADIDDGVGSDLMINCLPFVVATGSDAAGLFIASKPSTHHASFAFLPPGESEVGGLGPRLVSASGGWIANDYIYEEGPKPGEEMVQMSFMLTREGAEPPTLVMRYNHGSTPPPRRVPTVEKIGRNDPCYCGSGKKFKKCHGA